MSARYPFYELRNTRLEADGSTRRCFHAADESMRALFVWEEVNSPVLQAQLLLGDETFVEWRRNSVAAGRTNRAGDAGPAFAADHGRQHARHRGVRTLEPSTDERLLRRARDVLLASDLPPPLVTTLVDELSGHLGTEGTEPPAG